MSDKSHIAARADLIEELLVKRNFEDLGHLLTELETIQVTREHLQETQVVRSVYRVLKNCPIVTWQKKAKCLLAEWKALYKAQASPKLVGPEGKAEENPALSHESKQEKIAGVSCSDSLLSAQPVALAKAIETVTPSNSLGSVDSKEEPGEAPCLEQRAKELLDPTTPVRTKCRELLCEALASSSAIQPPTSGWYPFAREIEEHLCALHSKNFRKYKACVRSKVANLKNPKNSHLQKNLLSGVTSPKDFAEMSPLEMANQELQQLRASYTEAGIQEHALPQVMEGTQTQKIKCRRCERFNCKVTVIARGALFLPGWVRSANPDEDMMTYVICNECGEQWYHSRWVCL
ncbi:transcription elongation factor A N-terminal and central domain-containing protein [Suncus etruscus]|uniref:transcription elongation factor A N-terminal and central domain-containing protein n=1 Tax=Suncus etruscus TaxID=109475 RepID=UPI002110B5B3|nr:transcription elongation factor A N-terminal and central domain-containing protein [Suncus etruscus]